MRFDIRHHTLYTYSIPVLLGPQTVRLRPRPDGGMRELAWNLKLAPEPQSRSDQLDAEGNLVTRLWFAGETRHMDIDVYLLVQSSRSNAFDFVPDFGANRLPMDYAHTDAGALTCPISGMWGRNRKKGLPTQGLTAKIVGF